MSYVALLIHFRRCSSNGVDEEGIMGPRLMCIFASALHCFALTGVEQATAETYPGRPIKIIVPSAPGGPNDIPARLAAQFLPPKLAQPIVVENRPGAAGALGTREVAKATPDGYTLLSGGTSMLAVIPALSANAGYDPIKDFAPIAQFMEAFQVMVVHSSSPWMTVKDFVDDARANPGKFNWAHSGTAGLPHLTGELFISRTGIKIVGIPYRGSADMGAALLSQAVHMATDNPATVLPLVRAGKLRALAVTSRTRSAVAPEIPTMIEAGVPDYEVTSFFGLAGPAGTPVSVVKRLNATINEALRTPQAQETIAKLGAVPKTGSPEDFAATIAEHLEKWRSLGKLAGIKLD
jgi:tripartite-type tricarboxylate transporter receptor subunit TctC